MTRASVVVVGGGISGLAAAWVLSGGVDGPNDATPRVEVIEAHHRFGGSLATASFAGRTIDLGADGFLARRPEATALVDELGLSAELEAIGESGASLYSRGALRALPAGLVLGIPTDLGALTSFRGVSRRAHLAARRDYFFAKRLKVKGDTTIGSIVRAKLGDELAEQLVEPMIGGIQAGRIDELSAASVFPAVLDAALRGGSLMRALRANGPTNPGPPSDARTDTPVFYSLSDGVGSLPDVLARRLIERGVTLRHDVAVSALRRTLAGSYPWEVDTASTTTPANAVVLATPASITGALVGSLDAALEALRAIDTAGAAMVTFALASTNVTLPPRGTGVLVPLNTAWSGEGSLMVTAVTFLDRKWSRLARDGETVLRAHVGRSDDVRWSAMSDDKLTDRVTQELAEILGHFAAPFATRVQRWPNGLPQYRVGHAELVDRARAAAAAHGLALAGNAYDGVGVPASIGSGRRAASDVLAMLGSTN